MRTARTKTLSGKNLLHPRGRRHALVSWLRRADTRVSLLATLAALAGCASSPGEKNADAQSTITGGSPVVSAIAHKCLDDSGDQTENGNKIQLWDCNGTDAQSWKYTSKTFVGPGGKCLDIQHDKQVAGTPVWLYQCNGTTAQTWTIDGTAIKSTSGLCLNVAGGASADGTQVDLATCNGSSSQVWQVGSAPPSPPKDAGSPPKDAAKDTSVPPKDSGTSPGAETIASIVWDPSSYTYAAIGSDLWPATWMANDDVLLGWGDGAGFGPDPSTNYNSGPGRNSWGFTTITGTPPDLTFTNLWGGDNTLHTPTFGGKGGPILSASGELYFSIYCYYSPTTTYSNGKPANEQSGCPQTSSGTDDVAAILGYSTDQGADWAVTSWSFLGAFGGPIAFVQFGKDNSAVPSALGGSAYVYGYVNDGHGRYYLVRAPTKDVTTIGSYEILTGVSTANVPSWSSTLTDHSYPVGTSPSPIDQFVVYDPGIQRYIAAGTWGDLCGQVVFYESSNLWGPWTQFAHYANWPNENAKPNDLTTLPGANGTSSDEQADGFNLVPKWFSTDGLDFYVTYACYKSGGSYGDDDSYNDRFNLIRGTFVLAK
jgi:hypothetical protein